jgi:hypothetical protein
MTFKTLELSKSRNTKSRTGTCRRSLCQYFGGSHQVAETVVEKLPLHDPPRPHARAEMAI